MVFDYRHSPDKRVKPSAAIALAIPLIAVLALTACSPTDVDNGPEPSDPSSTSAPVEDPTETETPAPVETEAPVEEIQAGDELTAEDAQTLNESNELAVAYPVADKNIVVKWGEPVPEPVRAAVEENVKAATPGYGTQGNPDGSILRNALKAESEKLGGFSVAAVLCAMGATSDGGFAPTWAVSEPGPVGAYPNEQEAVQAVQDWVNGQPGNRTYVYFNHLGC